jgi:Amt family ammonium transporter
MGSVFQEFARRGFKKLEIDDPMDSISTHGVCGLWSLIALGLFENDKGILLTGNGNILGIQLIGAGSLLLLSITLSFVFFFPLKKMGRLRISKI